MAGMEVLGRWVGVFEGFTSQRVSAAVTRMRKRTTSRRVRRGRAGGMVTMWLGLKASMVSHAFSCGSIHEFGCSVARVGGCVNFKTAGLWGNRESDGPTTLREGRGLERGAKRPCRVGAHGLQGDVDDL